MNPDHCEAPDLRQLRIVLVEPSHPGNIGGTARAMKNMGICQLVLVNPPEDWQGEQARVRATSALDVLQQAQVVDSLEAAIAPCSLVLGASARLRSSRWPQMPVDEAAALTLGRAQQGDAVALVFGREKSGLTNAELDLCHALLHIPTNPACSSLNLAAAVQVVAWEIYRRHLGDEKPVSTTFEGAPRVSAEVMEGFYEHLFTLLQQSEFMDPDKNEHFRRRLRKLFNRAGMNQKEVDILRGIFRACQRKMGVLE
ncbi:tRNA/rRNA methyltransferase/tRNA (cytidine32/uridine32-2'-O)-methyltransferase [Sulfurivirga caldicuralii]|uniref:tRNA (cytidine/uridine-2'-O-)-methyltransferase TrmJ n=1 Tax=Sulfurivirga caldicuralii TaxID=364032 RepID=A0A1N6G8B1_9GAMM|nr:RNA methyltransferase [Sulfurivirga caldicuralii]SIO03652.1 tRNA/rRNA methyltransferase/tRNA (cytidine32/uridine32-2'-O)-methyltransferase [Sulfurivirga caldicuralii]